MPVDKFGRMSDLKTKDTGVSLTYINNNYVRSDGETPLTGSLDMRGNTLYNVADPVNPQDVVTKVYVDNTKGSGVIGRKTKDGVSIKENLDFLGKQKIKNLPDPVDGKDAVNRKYVDNLAINHPFEFKDNKYQAKTDLHLQGNKIQGVGTPFNDGDLVTKGYFESVAAPLLKLDEGKYKTKGDIDMSKAYTICNIKTPVKDEQITDKKYVDDQINQNSAFDFKNGSYYAKSGLIMKKNKLGGLREPLQDGEAATKKYVDDKTKNLFIDENDNIAFGLNVDMEGNQILGLPEPATDQEPATKKYVDDLQTQHVDEKGNIKFGRNVNLDNKRIFAMKEPKKANEGANKKYVDDTITKRLQEEKDNFLPQDPATKQYVDEAIKGLAGGDLLVSKEGVFIKANGHYRATASLDIDNHKMENLPDPVDEKDAVNKKYIDEIVENLTLKQGLIRENGGFNLVDSYINMNFNRVRNIPYPQHNEDAVPRSFLDGKINEVEERIQKIKEKSEERPFLKENGKYQALSSINMGFNRLLNLHKPTEPHEATTKEYVDVYFDETKENVENYKKETKKEVEEFIDTTKQDIEQFKEVTRQQLNINEDIIQNRVLQFNQLINIAAEYRGAINRNEIFYFSFFNHSINSNESFTMPLDGRIIKIKSHVKRTTLGEGVINETPIGFDVENKVLEFRLRVNGEERHIIFNPTQSSTTLSNPILLQPDDKITLYTESNEPIRIAAFIVLVIELNI